MSINKQQLDGLREKVTVNVDKGYSIQKSSFKGWSAFFKEYSSIQKDYSALLLKLSQDGGDRVGLKLPLPECARVENSTVQGMMAQMLYTVSTLSQFHHNFSERLLQLASVYSRSYDQVKATKQRFMQSLKEVFPQQIEKAGGIKQVAAKVSKDLYSMVDQLSTDEVSRIQKMREHCIIFYTLHKKIDQKQAQITGSHASRLSKADLQPTTAKNLAQLSTQILRVHNSYGVGQPLAQKEEKMVSAVRESLRQSIKQDKLKQSVIRAENSRGSLNALREEAEELCNSIIITPDPAYVSKRGLLSTYLKNYRELSQYINSQAVNNLCFLLISSYYAAAKDQEAIKHALSSIKARLKAQPIKSLKGSGSIQEFVQSELPAISNSQNIGCWQLMTRLSRYYQGTLTEGQLQNLVSANVGPEENLGEVTLHPWICSSVLDVLLSTLFRSLEGEQFLISNYSEVFGVILQFGVNMLKTQPHLALMLFLQRVTRQSVYRIQTGQEPAEFQLEPVLSLEDCTGEASAYTQYLRSMTINRLTTRIIGCYKSRSSLTMGIQLFSWLDKYFNAENANLDRIWMSLRLSGFRYLQSKDPAGILFGKTWENYEKVKNLSEVVRDNEYMEIDEHILQPVAGSIAMHYNLGQEITLNTVRNNFLHYVNLVIVGNLDAIQLSNLGNDKDGHLLRLGIELCKLDELTAQPLTTYNNYFRLLGVALDQMEQEYRQLLQQTRNTEIWVVQEGMSATQNCYDFCSLLAKPIQFMSNTLKQINTGRPTEFKLKFVAQIKAKLTVILKSQISAYSKFLDLSLKKLAIPDPCVQLSPPKIQKLEKPLTQEQQQRELQQHRECCLRLSNIAFLKLQINEIAKDLIDPTLQAQLKGNIFAENKLSQAVRRVNSGDEQELLLVLEEVVTGLNLMENVLVEKVSKGTVYFFCRRFFQRLYWRPEKNAFEQFFTTKDQASKMSEFTFMMSKNELVEYLAQVRRYIPAEYTNHFETSMLTALFLSTKKQIINAAKFRINTPLPTLSQYLNTDFANIASLIKKEIMDEDKVERYWYGPLRKLLEDYFRQNTLSALTDRFEQAMLKKKSNECEEILAALNLRATDSRAKDFVKKYKNTVLKS